MCRRGSRSPPRSATSTTARKSKIPAAIDREIADHLKRLEKVAGATLGSSANPLLVSVRSGAQVLDARHDGHDSQPGPERSGRRRPEERTNNGRALPSIATADSFRCSATSSWKFRRKPSSTNSKPSSMTRHAKLDTDLNEKALREVVGRYKEVVQKRTGKAFPQDPHQQLQMARDAVFRSWHEPARAGIPAHVRHPRPHRNRGQRARRWFSATPGDRSAHWGRLHAESRRPGPKSSTASS